MNHLLFCDSLSKYSNDASKAKKEREKTSPAQ